ncbi:MAG: hypothetical protein WC517_03855 [Patescibacteria group bacterium]
MTSGQRLCVPIERLQEDEYYFVTIHPEKQSEDYLNPNKFDLIRVTHLIMHGALLKYLLIKYLKQQLECPYATHELLLTDKRRFYLATPKEVKKAKRQIIKEELKKNNC